MFHKRQAFYFDEFGDKIKIFKTIINIRGGQAKALLTKIKPKITVSILILFTQLNNWEKNLNWSETIELISVLSHVLNDIVDSKQMREI